MEKSVKKSAMVSLSTMMFFQYIMFAVWWVPLAAYLAQLEVSRNLSALILSSMAFGSMVSPMVGNLADKYFKGQHLLAFSNAIVAVMLLLSGITRDPVILFITLLIAMLFYMPTWAITSAIALRHVPSEIFPRVRVFGTIGWILAGIFSLISVQFFQVDFDGTQLPFFFGAGLAAIAAVFNFTLPDTPPMGKGTKTSFLDIMGFRSLVLLKDKNYAVFLIIFFLAMIPFSMYWSYFSEYLLSSGYRLITVTMSLGQVMEIFILLTVPFSIKKFGLRNTMIIGIIALIVRYASLYLAGNEADIAFVLLGVVVHGLIFGYYHIGAQIYTDKIAPPHLKSQAQGLIFFVTFAMGLLLGNFISGWVIDIFSEQTALGIQYRWDAIWGVTTLMSVAVLLSFLLFFKNEKTLP
ncbi:MAG TPA: MFS transporter [Bacteroidales bacterium]|nr:MFS transporter [Bacteroidales bacterium]